jgi:nucleoside-diphosphate-sugar epimerase
MRHRFEENFMQYFVTGATGFIGKRLVKLLAAQGRRGALPDAPRQRGQGGGPARILGRQRKHARCRCTGDLTGKKLGVCLDDVKALKGQIDHFYHLAAVYDLSADEESQVRSTSKARATLVEFAKAVDAGHVHHVSSASPPPACTKGCSARTCSRKPKAWTTPTS